MKNFIVSINIMLPGTAFLSVHEHKHPSTYFKRQYSAVARHLFLNI